MKGKGFDGHVRLEGDEIMVDIFDSSIKDANDAHVESQAFPYTPAGAREATRFLKDNNINRRIAVS